MGSAAEPPSRAEPLVRGQGGGGEDRPVELADFSVFHSVQCDSARGTAFPLEKLKENAVPPRSPSV